MGRMRSPDTDMTLSCGGRSRSYYTPPSPDSDPTDEAMADTSFLEDELIVPTIVTERTTHIGGFSVGYTLEQAEDPELRDEALTVITNGYGGAEFAYAKLRTALAQAGKRALTVKQVRSRGILRDLDPRQLAHPERLASQAAWGAMRDVMVEDGIEVFDIFGHSLGGLTAAELAEQKADFVRTATFAGAVGLEPHTRLQMVKRGIECGRKEILPATQEMTAEEKLEYLIETVQHLLRNPGLTLAEGIVAAGCKLRGRIDTIRDAGVTALAIQFQ